MTFAHLHVHTDASLKDGLGSVRRTVDAANRQRFGSLAITDHGTLANAIRFNTECERVGIKPIQGLEGYITVDGEIGHITLLADGDRGFSNLIKLVNLGHRGPYRQPAFTVDQLKKHSQDLVCLTGCMASPLQSMPLYDAIALGAKLKESFGHRLFAELMLVSDSMDSWTRGIQLSERLGIKSVLTNDVHFANKEDAPVHPVLTNLKARFSYQSELLYLRSLKSLRQRATDLGVFDIRFRDSAIRASNIAKLIRPVNLKQEPKLPHLGGGCGVLADTPLKKIWKAAHAVRTVKGDGPEYSQRIEDELVVINDTGFPEYFLIVEDLVSWAKGMNIAVGPGRGSGAGSLILYYLGITDIDPIKHGLSFERFLNADRGDMPDVDVDFEADRRAEVLAYAEKKYGATPISTYSTYSHRSLVRDLGRHFSVDKALVEDACDHGRDSEQFDDFADGEPLIAQSYDTMLGQIRHKGKHAGGVIITEREVPIERVANKQLASSWTEGTDHDLSYAGVVKFDLLGLSVLSALAELKKVTGKEPHDPTQSLGSGAYELFRKGDLTGVFQFSNSPGIRQLCIDVQPETFQDIYAINALFRPGPLDAGVTGKFHEYKKKPRKVPGFIKDVLEETYGVIVYQEQLMEIYARAVGGALAEGDTVRRLIVKEYRKAIAGDPVWIAEFDKITKKFVGGCMSNHGLTEVEAIKLWNEIKTFASYGFNKSHAVAYSMISWSCAWYKHNFPSEFYAAMLNHDPDKAQAYIYEAIAKGLKVKPPRINKSHATKYKGSSSNIYTPLIAVKFLGQKGAEELERIREGFGGAIPDGDSFMGELSKRKVNKRARQGLFDLGAFDSLHFKLKGRTRSEVLCIEIPTHIYLNTPEVQLERLGYVIPSSNFVHKAHAEEALGNTVGIISSKEHRKSKYNGKPYVVYKLQPSGVFWSRDKQDLEEGLPVSVKIGKKGKLLKLRRLTL